MKKTMLDVSTPMSSESVLKNCLSRDQYLEVRDQERQLQRAFARCDRRQICAGFAKLDDLRYRGK